MKRKISRFVEVIGSGSVDFRDDLLRTIQCRDPGNRAGLERGSCSECTVTLVNDATGVKQATVSGASGVYRFTSLIAGNYTV
jgi:hypothetical protein